MDLFLLDRGAANKNQMSHLSNHFRLGIGVLCQGLFLLQVSIPRRGLLSLLLLLSPVVFASRITDLPLSSKAQTSREARATSHSLLTLWEAPQGLARTAASVCLSRVCLGWYLPHFIFLQEIFCHC